MGSRSRLRQSSWVRSGCWLLCWQRRAYYEPIRRQPCGANSCWFRGEHELLPGLRLLPAPGHTRGMQVVVVETGGRPLVVGGDVAVWFGELDEPHTEGQLRVRALDPELVWLAHTHEPWRPRTV